MRAALSIFAPSGQLGSWLVSIALILVVPSSYGQIPISGPNVQDAAEFDSRITALMTKWNIPGASVAVSKGGKLVLARGYGYSIVDGQAPVKPDSLFRIASISKPITSTAIMKLVEGGKINLDATFLSYLPEFDVPNMQDQRIRNITIRQLLEHSSGWQPTADPMFSSTTIAQQLNVEAPAKCRDIIRYMVQQNLDTQPGIDHSYLNFGYCILGRVIEAVSGLPYEDYVQKYLLRPIGINDMRIGHSLFAKNSPNEVTYYDYSGAPLVNSVFTGYATPRPNGGFYLEALDSVGGWIASSIDLARILDAFNPNPTTQLLTPSSIQQMWAKPALAEWATSPYWYGLGWLYNTNSNAWHGGSLPGTTAYAVHSSNGFNWAFLANSRPADSQNDAFVAELDTILWDAINNFTPNGFLNMYPTFPSNSTKSRPADLVMSSPTGTYCFCNDRDWRQLSNAPAVHLAAGDFDGDGVDELIEDRGSSQGIWIRYSNGNWQQLLPNTSLSLAVGDIDNNGAPDLVADLTSSGIWIWMNSTVWTQVSTFHSTALAVANVDQYAGDEIVISKGGTLGTHSYSHTRGWSIVNSATAGSLAIGDFDGNGYNDLAASLGQSGLYIRYVYKTPTVLFTWKPIRNGPVSQMKAGYVNEGNKADLLADFGPSNGGLMLYANDNSWAPISSTSPETIVMGDFDRNGEDDFFEDYGNGQVYLNYDYGYGALWTDKFPIEMIPGNMRAAE